MTGLLKNHKHHLSYILINLEHVRDHVAERREAPTTFISTPFVFSDLGGVLGWLSSGVDQA
jgi:hypothetical protein